MHRSRTSARGKQVRTPGDTQSRTNQFVAEVSSPISLFNRETITTSNPLTFVNTNEKTVTAISATEKTTSSPLTFVNTVEQTVTANPDTPIKITSAPVSLTIGSDAETGTSAPLRPVAEGEEETETPAPTKLARGFDVESATFKPMSQRSAVTKSPFRSFEPMTPMTMTKMQPMSFRPMGETTERPTPRSVALAADRMMAPIKSLAAAARTADEPAQAPAQQPASIFAPDAMRGAVATFPPFIPFPTDSSNWEDFVTLSEYESFKSMSSNKTHAVINYQDALRNDQTVVVLKDDLSNEVIYLTSTTTEEPTTTTAAPPTTPIKVSDFDVSGFKSQVTQYFASGIGRLPSSGVRVPTIPKYAPTATAAPNDDAANNRKSRKNGEYDLTDIQRDVDEGMEQTVTTDDDLTATPSGNETETSTGESVTESAESATSDSGEAAASNVTQSLEAVSEGTSATESLTSTDSNQVNETETPYRNPADLTKPAVEPKHPLTREEYAKLLAIETTPSHEPIAGMETSESEPIDTLVDHSGHDAAHNAHHDHADPVFRGKSKHEPVEPLVDHLGHDAVHNVHHDHHDYAGPVFRGKVKNEHEEGFLKKSRTTERTPTADDIGQSRRSGRYRPLPNLPEDYEDYYRPYPYYPVTEAPVQPQPPPYQPFEPQPHEPQPHTPSKRKKAARVIDMSDEDDEEAMRKQKIEALISKIGADNLSPALLKQLEEELRETTTSEPTTTIAPTTTPGVADVKEFVHNGIVIVVKTLTNGEVVYESRPITTRGRHYRPTTTLPTTTETVPTTMPPATTTEDIYSYIMRMMRGDETTTEHVRERKTTTTTTTTTTAAPPTTTEQDYYSALLASLRGHMAEKATTPVVTTEEPTTTEEDYYGELMKLINERSGKKTREEATTAPEFDSMTDDLYAQLLKMLGEHGSTGSSTDWPDDDSSLTTVEEIAGLWSRIRETVSEDPRKRTEETVTSTESEVNSTETSTGPIRRQFRKVL